MGAGVFCDYHQEADSEYEMDIQKSRRFIVTAVRARECALELLASCGGEELPGSEQTPGGPSSTFWNIGMVKPFISFVHNQEEAQLQIFFRRFHSLTEQLTLQDLVSLVHSMIICYYLCLEERRNTLPFPVETLSSCELIVSKIYEHSGKREIEISDLVRFFKSEDITSAF